MAEPASTLLPRLNAEQRRVVAGQFERANQVLSKGDHDYAIQLLINCCKLDPANATYRQNLRKTQKAKYQNNMRGQRLAFLRSFPAKVRMRSALRSEDYLKVLDYGERILVRNPWDIYAQLIMSRAFVGLGLVDLGVWTLEQARQVKTNHLGVNRALAQLYEKRGNFAQAMALWEMVRKADPNDLEAQDKAKDIAAAATIARGKYEEVLSGESSSPAVFVPPKDGSKPAARAVGEDRISREAAPLLARIEADPSNPATYLQVANLFRRSDQLDRAAQILVQGLGPTGNHFELTLELADLETEPFRRDLALTEGKLRQKPKDKELQKIRAGLLKEINARELDYFRRKSDRYPHELSHKYEVGVRLFRTGQYEEAIKELQSARNDPVRHGKALYYLGFCFQKRNNWRLAQRNFEEALQHLGAKDEEMRKEILFHLAQGLAEAGDLTRAVELGFELANVDYNYQDIGRLVEEWQARLQKA